MTMIGSGIVYLGESKGWSRTSGDYIERRWRGTIEQAEAKEAELRQVGGADDVKVEDSGGLKNVVARFSKNPDDPGNEVPEDSVRIVPGRAMKSIFEPRFFPGIRESARKDIKTAVDGNKSIAANALNQADIDAGAGILFYLAKHNQDSILITSFNLYWTQTASRVHHFGFNYDNVGTIITTATLMAETRIGAADYPLPAYEWENPGTLPAGLTFVYGWYKSYPQLTFAARNKLSFSAEYEYGLWPLPPYRYTG